MKTRTIKLLTITGYDAEIPSEPAVAYVITSTIKSLSFGMTPKQDIEWGAQIMISSPGLRQREHTGPIGEI